MAVKLPSVLQEAANAAYRNRRSIQQEFAKFLGTNDCSEKFDDYEVWDARLRRAIDLQRSTEADVKADVHGVKE